jgi:hypothetical protein
MRKTRSLLGTAARTAVITGTAKAVLGKGNAPAAPPAAPAAAAPAAAGMSDDKIAMLQKLGELQKSGVLTEEEFAAEKAKILAA